ncbi:MAG: DegT/DnrJ/EryC1/StrS family aminotransferase, partial [Alkaliphilus sp.]
MTETKKRLYLSPSQIDGRGQQYVEEVFAANEITAPGAQVYALEQELAAAVHSKGALALSSAAAAIHLALRLLEVERGEVVFCSSFTSVASANPILYQAAKPVF